MGGSNSDTESEESEIKLLHLHIGHCPVSQEHRILGVEPEALRVQISSLLISPSLVRHISLKKPCMKGQTIKILLPGRPLQYQKGIRDTKSSKVTPTPADDVIQGGKWHIGQEMTDLFLEIQRLFKLSHVSLAPSN